jgi:hypothetical protein
LKKCPDPVNAQPQRGVLTLVIASTLKRLALRRLYSTGMPAVAPERIADIAAV